MKDTAAQIDATLTITLARPLLAADPAADGWADVSTVVVQRFLDSYWVKHGVSRETLEAYRVDLDGLVLRSRASNGSIRTFWRAGIAAMTRLSRCLCALRDSSGAVGLGSIEPSSWAIANELYA
jgi:hypothetical protein